MLVTGGNHEIGSSEAWLHYMHRWPTPYREARSTSPLYWSADVGPAHIVALNSYDNFVHHGDRLQRKWLEDDLSKVDWMKTPWLVVMMHAPFYNSNSAHALEAELMRLAYEPLLLKYGVDVVLSGHVHAYERSDAGGIYDAQPNACGPVYLNLGDGGNREGGEAAWVAPQYDRVNSDVRRAAGVVGCGAVVCSEVVVRRRRCAARVAVPRVGRVRRIDDIQSAHSKGRLAEGGPRRVRRDPRRLASFPIAAVAEVEVDRSTYICLSVIDTARVAPFVRVDVAAQHDVNAVFQ